MKLKFSAVFILLFIGGWCQKSSIFSVPIMPPSEKDKSSGPGKQMMQTEMPMMPDDKPGSAIIFKGWLRYFYYMPTGKEKEPNQFEYNSAFAEQMSGGIMPSRMKDAYGYLDIPTETSFFFVLTHKTLYALSARKNGVAKTVKSLQISWIQPTFVHGMNVMSAKGGLENIGDFDEGFCFRLRLRTGMVWDLCSDKAGEKSKWMNSLYPLVPKLGPNTQGQAASIGDGGGVVSSVATKFVYNASLWFNATDEDSQLTKKRDGKWVILHDWSQCSKVCGGGESFQQRMCIPPIGGGRPCFGETIISKKCNEHACPNTIIDDISDDSGGGIKNSVHVSSTAAPIIKIQKLSDRYQKFSPCLIKESSFLG